MATIVVVSTSEISRDSLAGAVSADDEVHVVVPAVDQTRLQWLANDEDAARAEAQEVGESIARAAPGDAAEVEVEVKPDPPEQVVRDAVAEHRPDRIVVALRDGEDASWLESGALDELGDELGGVPVERIRIASGP